MIIFLGLLLLLMGNSSAQGQVNTSRKTARNILTDVQDIEIQSEESRGMIQAARAANVRAQLESDRDLSLDQLRFREEREGLIQALTVSRAATIEARGLVTDAQSELTLGNIQNNARVQEAQAKSVAALADLYVDSGIAIGEAVGRGIDAFTRRRDRKAEEKRASRTPLSGSVHSRGSRVRRAPKAKPSKVKSASHPPIKLLPQESTQVLPKHLRFRKGPKGRGPKVVKPPKRGNRAPVRGPGFKVII